MTVCILKPCEIRHNSALLNVAPGEYLTLADRPEGKLIDAGLARQTTPEDYHAMMEHFGKHSPACGWETVKTSFPETWCTHIKAVRSGDIATAVRTFNELLNTAAATN